MDSGPEPYTIASNHGLGSIYPSLDETYHSNAQQESHGFFGIQSDNHYSSYCSRQALKERSINIQHENHLHKVAFATKEAVPYPTDLPRTGPLVFPDSSLPYLWDWSVSWEREFRTSWGRSWKCDPFRDYRTAPTKPDKVAKNDDKKWTPLREEMFFRALCRWPPMGREKIKYFSQNPENRDKMMGRNELLADFINSALKLREPPNEDGYPKGECPEVFIPAEELALTRKQISSHLQVLKTKFKADKWVIDVYLGEKHSKGQRPQGRSAFHGRPNLSGRLRSNQVLSRSAASRDALAAHARSLHVPTLPSQSGSRHRSGFEPADFCIYMRSNCDFKHSAGHQCSSSQNCRSRKIHEFTKTQRDVRGPDTRLENTPSIAGALPELARGQDCPVLYASATLALPSHAISPGEQNLELAIDSTFVTDEPLDPSLFWYVKTRFFEGGQPASWSVNGVETKSATQALSIDSTGHGGKYRHSIPFGSSYWVKLVSKLDRLQKDAERAADPTIDAMELDEDNRTARRPGNYHLDKIKSAVNSTTALQEIFAKTKDQHETKRRCLIIYWRFSQTTHVGEVGTTVFRNLLIVKPETGDRPDSRSQIDVQQAATSHHMLNGHLGSNDYIHSSTDHPPSTNLDALASAASAASLDADFYNFDWSTLETLGNDDLTQLQAMSDTAATFSGAEAESYSSFAALQSSYTLPSVDPHLDFNSYDALPDVVSHHNMSAPSANHSSVTSPCGDTSFESDYLVSNSGSGESQPSTAASSYAPSAGFLPSQQQWSQHSQLYPGFDFNAQVQNFGKTVHRHGFEQYTHVSHPDQGYQYEQTDSQVGTQESSQSQEGDETLRVHPDQEWDFVGHDEEQSLPPQQDCPQSVIQYPHQASQQPPSQENNTQAIVQYSHDQSHHYSYIRSPQEMQPQHCSVAEQQSQQPSQHYPHYRPQPLFLKPSDCSSEASQPYSSMATSQQPPHPSQSYIYKHVQRPPQLRLDTGRQQHHSQHSHYPYLESQHSQHMRQIQHSQHAQADTQDDSQYPQDDPSSQCYYDYPQEQKTRVYSQDQASQAYSQDAQTGRGAAGMAYMYETNLFAHAGAVADEGQREGDEGWIRT